MYGETVKRFSNPSDSTTLTILGEFTIVWQLWITSGASGVEEQSDCNTNTTVCRGVTNLDTILKSTHYHLASDFSTHPQDFAHNEACNKQTQHFSLISQEELWQNCLERIVLIHQVFLVLVGTHPQNASLQAAIVVLLREHHLWNSTTAYLKEQNSDRSGICVEVFICDLGSDFTGEGVTPLIVYYQQNT